MIDKGDRVRVKSIDKEGKVKRVIRVRGDNTRYLIRLDDGDKRYTLSNNLEKL